MCLTGWVTVGNPAGTMHAKVLVTLRPGVLDPAGQAVASSLRQLGFDEVLGVRIGKVLEIELEAATTEDEARARLEQMSERLLANPVIETFEIELDDPEASNPSKGPSHSAP